MRKIFSLVILCLIYQPVLAANYYISLSGSNASGDGSPGKPWATLNHAFSVAGGGNTFILKDGDYSSASGFDAVPPDGTAINPTVIRAEHQRKARLGGLTFNTTNHNYITVDGIRLGGVWNANHNTFKGCVFQNMSSGSFLMCGSDNKILSNYIDASGNEWGINMSGCYTIAKNNLIQDNIIANVGGTKGGYPVGQSEGIEYDSGGKGNPTALGEITSVSGSTITISTIYSDRGGQNNPDPLAGSNAVGMAALIVSGNARGNYYAITAQNGTALTLDTSRFPLTSVHAAKNGQGDYVMISPAFVENEISNNTLRNFQGVDNTDVDYPQPYNPTGINMFTLCYGNYIHDNIIDIITPGVELNGRYFTALFDAGYHTTPPTWHVFLNSRNVYKNNHLIGNYGTHAIEALTFYEGAAATSRGAPTLPENSSQSPYAPVNLPPYGLFSYGIVFENNFLDGGNGVVIADINNATCSHNGTTTVSTIGPFNEEASHTTFMLFDTLQPVVTVPNLSSRLSVSHSSVEITGG